MPSDMPAIMPSASGVSCTRSLPNFSCRPAVARNTPPFTPTSSPSTTTVGSCAISHACARLMASIIVTLAMSVGILLSKEISNGEESVAGRGGVTFGQLALLGSALRQAGEQEVEHAVRVLLRRVQIFLDGRVDLLRAFGFQLFFALLVPVTRLREVRAQAEQGLGAPGVLHFF